MATNMIQALFDSKKGADVVFVVEGEEISGHRALLSISCPYFDAMLFGATNEAKMGKIELNSTPLRQFKEIVRYCYLREIQIDDWSDEEVVKLLTLAHEYQLNELVLFIETDLREKRVNVSNLNLVFNVAALLDRNQLLETCLLVAESNARETVEANNLVTYSGALLSALMERSTFREHKQDEILAGIAKWKECHNSDELKWVLKKINWEKVSPNLVLELTRELVDKTNCSELCFWDTATKWTIAAHTKGSSPMSYSEDALAAVKTAAQGSSRMVTKNNPHFSPPPRFTRPPFSTLSASNPRAVDHLGGALQEHSGANGLDSSFMKTYTVGDLILRSGTEHRFTCELGDFQIWLTRYDVRIVFSEQSVYLQSISFEVDNSVSPTIKNVQCNGKHHKAIQAFVSPTTDTFVFNVNVQRVTLGRITQVNFSLPRDEIALLSFRIRAGKAEGI